MDYTSVRLESVKEQHPQIFQAYSEFEVRCEVCQRFGKHEGCNKLMANGKTKGKQDNANAEEQNNKQNNGGKAKNKRKRKKKGKKTEAPTSASQGTYMENLIMLLKKNNVEDMNEVTDNIDTLHSNILSLLMDKTESFRVFEDFLNKVNLEEVMGLVRKLMEAKEPRDCLDALCQHVKSVDELNDYNKHK